MHQAKGKLIKQASTILSEQFNLDAFYYKKISSTGRLTVFESNLDLLDCIDSAEFVLNYPVICHPKYHRNEIQLKHNSENKLLDPVKGTRNILTDFNFNLGLRLVRLTTNGVEEFGFHSILDSGEQCRFLFNRMYQLRSFINWFLKTNASTLLFLEEAALDLPKLIGPSFYKNRIQETNPEHVAANKFYQKLDIPIDKPLSSTELETLRLLMRGYTALEIATELNRSKRTIEHRIDTLKMKWLCDSKKDLIQKAQELDLYGYLQPSF